MLKKVVLPIICLASITTFVVANSFAWFTESNKKTPTINGSTPTAYYKSGDGTKDNPYVIARPVHLYNFAWLQYMGTYNKVDDDGTVKQTYFKIDDELATDSNGNKVLDMKGYALPPLGTEDNPFVGDFDGNGAIITNLTISNKYGDYSRTPSSVTSSNFDAPQVIGLFGVVGATDTSKAYEYSSTTDALVHDVYAENLTIKNDTSSNKQTLAGLLAGYVNAPMLNCGVGLGTFDLASGTTSLGTYNGTTLKGVSDYALVGSYNSENFSWSIPDGGGGGQGNDWGGSIDFASFSKRISSIAASVTPTSNANTRTYTATKFNTIIFTTTNSKSPGYSWNDTLASASGQTAALQEGTYLPLNIDLKEATIYDPDTTIADDNVGAYYKEETTTSEPVLSNNTGYIVGYKETGNATPRLRHKLTKKYSSGDTTYGIPYSISYFDNGKDLPSTNNVVDPDDVFKSSEISLFYLNSSNATKRIRDDDNKNTSFNTNSGKESYIDKSTLGFSNYDNAKSQFITMLKSGTPTSVLNDSAIRLNGLQLLKTDLSYGDYSNVTIDKTLYASYQMIKGGINFTLDKDGVVTMIVGTYAGGSNHVLPAFYEITRTKTTDSEGKIASTISKSQHIYKVYKNSDANIEYTYDKDTTISDTNLAIDLYNLNMNAYLNFNSAYYFEIPLKAGDYFIGNDTGASNYPYFLYLDIGANAGDSGDEDDDSSPWPIDFVYFDSNKTLVKISTDKDSSGNYIYKNSEALFQINETASGIIEFKRKDGDGTVVYYYITSGSTITVVAIATEGKYEISTSNLTPIYTTSN